MSGKLDVADVRRITLDRFQAAAVEGQATINQGNVSLPGFLRIGQPPKQVVCDPFVRAAVNFKGLVSHFLFSVVSLAATTRRRRLLTVNPSASGATPSLGS
jgi:hypothetical protein